MRHVPRCTAPVPASLVHPSSSPGRAPSADVASTRVVSRRPLLLGLVLGGGLLLAGSGMGCGGDPAGTGSGGNTASGGASASGGAGTGGAGSGGAATGGASTGGASSGGRSGTGGSPSTGGSGSGGRATGGSASGGAGTATGGSGAGSGGQGTGGGGTGGSGNGGTGPTGGAGGRAGTGGSGTGGSSSSGGMSGGATGCPADATFCSGFESAEFPAGAKYVTYQGSNNPTAWTQSFAVDTAVYRNGKSSLRVRSKKEANGPTDAYRMLSVAAPGPAFWVRFYLRSDTELGTSARVHNEFGAAAGSADPNEPTSLEFAEDRGIAFNSKDDVRRPDGYSFDKPYLLPPNTWYCIELGFDSATRHQVMYIDGMKRIDAADYPMAAAIKSPFAVYNFGLRDYHGFEGAMWLDDMIVSKTRVPCP